MNPSTSEHELCCLIKKTNVSIENLSPAEGIRLMLSFYKNIRSEGCDLDADGDMLLYQWGTYDWGEGRFFEFDITRQFIADTDEDDNVISQLRFTFYYCPCPELDELKSGNKWCETPEGLEEFESFIISTSAYNTVSNFKQHKVEVSYSEV